ELVSAVEAAANQAALADMDPVELLESADRPLFERMRQNSDPKLLAEVAVILAPKYKATAKFLGFLQKHAPAPPAERPAQEMLRVEWERLRKALEVVYDWRSKALHEAIPFPAPLCMLVMFGSWPPPERPLPGIITK